MTTAAERLVAADEAEVMRLAVWHARLAVFVVDVAQGRHTEATAREEALSCCRSQGLCCRECGEPMHDSSLDDRRRCRACRRGKYQDEIEEAQRAEAEARLEREDGEGR